MRNLEREIGNICRKVARKVVKEGEKFSVTLTAENVSEYLGVMKFRDSEVHERSEVGLGHRTGMDRGRRLDSHHRSRHRGRQGQAHADRQAGRRDAGVGTSGHVLCALARASAGTAARLLPQPRHPRACARGSDPEGRPIGGHHHGNGHRQRARAGFRCAATSP